MFGRLYLAELKKQAKPKILIIFGVIAIVFMVIALLLYLFVEDMATNLDFMGNDAIKSSISFVDVNTQTTDFGNVTTDEILKNTESYSKEECAQLLPELEAKLVAAKKYAKEHTYGYLSGYDISEYYGSGDYVYNIRAQYNLVKYIDDNGYYDREFIVYEGENTTYSEKMLSYAAEDLLIVMSSAFNAVAQILAIVLGAVAVATELKAGTLKLMLLRPISREKLLGAKYLAGYSIVVAFTSLGFILSTIIGYSLKPATGAEMLFVFNSTDVYFGSASLGVFYTYLFTLVSQTAYYSLAFGLGTMLKNMVAGIVLPLVADVATLVVSAICIAPYWFTNAINWNSYFGMGNSLYGGSHFVIAFFMTAFYIVLTVGGSLLTFHKRDVA